MRTSEVQELDPSDVFDALWLKTRRSARPSLADKASRTGSVWGGQSPRTRSVLRLIEKVGKKEWPVIIVGEPGTGKEVVARAIHDASRTGPFVVINCRSTADPLTESELFGYVKGAFAGASTAKAGLIEGANGGTAFLDGIDALPLDLQAKLLRVLQEKEFCPFGSTSTRRSDFRVITATDRDLATEVEAGTFRRDLFFRLNVVNVRLAPLRERKEDIPALVHHFLARLDGNYIVTTPAMDVMLHYDWPGNVRELESCIRHMASVSTGQVLDTKDFPPDIQHFLSTIGGTSLFGGTRNPLDFSTFDRLSRQIPKSLWAHALQTFGSASLATEWFLAACGALDNRAPIDAIRSEDGRQEVDRVLGCIDYGMIA